MLFPLLRLALKLNLVMIPRIYTVLLQQLTHLHLVSFLLHKPFPLEVLQSFVHFSVRSVVFLSGQVFQNFVYFIVTKTKCLERRHWSFIKTVQSRILYLNILNFWLNWYRLLQDWRRRLKRRFIVLFPLCHYNLRIFLNTLLFQSFAILHGFPLVHERY